MFTLDRRKKNILILGAILLTVAIAYRFMPLIGNLYPPQDELDALAEQLVNYRNQLKKLKHIKARKQALETALQKRKSNLFGAETASLAAVEVQNIIDQIFSENNVEISSIQVIDEKPVKNKPYIQVPIRLTFASTISRLQKILYAIESSPRYLKVDEARFRSSSSGGKNRLISVTITISGLMNPANA